MLDNFLSVGDLIIARIQAQVPTDFTLVAHAADLAGVKDSTQVVPACHIVYLGATVGSELAPGVKTGWDQDWMTVIVVRSVQQAKQLVGAMKEAGPRAGRLIQALSGWAPADGVMPLRPVAPGVPPLPSAAGTLYLPLRWRARVTQYGIE